MLGLATGLILADAVLLAGPARAEPPGGPGAPIERSAPAPRSFGAKPAPAGTWPFLVAIVPTDTLSNPPFVTCGGTLIDPWWVLTTAKCVDAVQPAALQVFSHAQDLQPDLGVRTAIADFVVHPRYVAASHDYDVALVKLAAPIADIPPIRLVDKRRRDLAADGVQARLAGWGSLSDDDTDRAGALSQVSVPVVANTRCNDPKDGYDGAVTARMLCAGYDPGGKDACYYDLGGPLIIPNGAGTKPLQIGIASWGSRCGGRTQFGVYTRVSAVSGWVAAVIDGTVRSTRSTCTVSDPGTRAACIDLAIALAARRNRAILSRIAEDATPAVISALQAGQAAWEASLGPLCAYDAATEGPEGRKLCILRETESRGAALAGSL
jgi:secreted trypsin-like serine protease